MTWYDEMLKQRDEGRKEGREEGRKEGREEGRKEGIKEGMADARCEIALSMLKKNMAIDLISELSKLSTAQVKQLAEKNHLAML